MVTESTAPPGRAGALELLGSILLGLPCIAFPAVFVAALSAGGGSLREGDELVLGTLAVAWLAVAVAVAWLWALRYHRLWTVPALAGLGLGFWPALLVLANTGLRRRILPYRPGVECGHEVGPGAQFCPVCGRPVGRARRSSGLLPKLLVGTVAVVFGGVGLAIAADVARELSGLSGGLPIHEDFSGACPWPEGDRPAYTYSCTGTAYRMHLKRDGSYHSYRGYRLDAAAIQAQVDARVGDGRDAALGISCLSAGARPHGYVGMVGTDGSWAIARLDRDFVWLAGTNRAGTVKVVGSSPRLGITCAGGPSGTTVELAVNGQPVGAVVDAGGYRTFAGLGLWTQSTPGDVDFDNLDARVPAPADIGSAGRLARAPVPLLADDFADPSSGWGSRTDADGSSTYAAGGYRITLGRSTFRAAYRTFVPTVLGARVAATATTPRGAGRTAAGVSCGSRDLDREYGFQITPDGGFEIYRQERRRASVDIAHGTVSMSTPGRPLRIAAACIPGTQSTRLVMAVNGAVIARIADPHRTPAFDFAGLFVNGARGGTVSFDDVAVDAVSASQAAALMAAPIAGDVPAGPSPAVPHTPGTLLRDDFSDDTGFWPVQAYQDYSTVIRNGVYRLRAIDHDVAAQGDGRLLHPSPAITVDADVTERQAPMGASVSCDAGSRSLEFVVDAPGRRYSVWQADGDTATEIVGGLSSAIHTTGRNHVRAVCAAGSNPAAMFVNGRRVTLAAPLHALDAYTGVTLETDSGRQPADVVFDNIVVRPAAA